MMTKQEWLEMLRAELRNRERDSYAQANAELARAGREQAERNRLLQELVKEQNKRARRMSWVG